MKNIAVIVCAGSGKRMEANKPKQFICVNDKPIICYTIEKFQKCLEIDEIILVTNKEYFDYLNQILKEFSYGKVTKVVLGGAERFESVYNGIEAIEYKECIVLVHDGVRPFITIEKIKLSIEAAKEYGACILAVKSKETLKVATKDGFVENTLERDSVYNVQTPQAFKYSIIKKAYQNIKSENILPTDDATLVENLGFKVKILEGDYSNVKITTKEDLIFFNS